MRRAFLAQAASLAGAATLGGCASIGSRNQRSAMVGPDERPAVVLVHGAWHGGWAWEPIVPMLEQQGFAVHAPTLTGLGERADELTAQTGLNTHIDDITNYIAERDLHRIVLVGHSYGGMVITGVTDRLKERVAHAVYVDAAVPEDGDSMIDRGPDREPEKIAAQEAQLRALVGQDGAMAVLPVSVFGIPEDHPRAGWVRERLTPHPFKSWTDRIALANAGSEGLARTYIYCTQPPLDPAGSPTAERIANDATWRFREIATGHDAMVTDPQTLAAMLIEAARSEAL